MRSGSAGGWITADNYNQPAYSGNVGMIVHRTIEQEQALALKDFRSYLRTYEIKGRDLNYRLRFYIDDWLAQPARVQQLALTSRPFHEVLAIADFIEVKTRESWTAAAKETRRRRANPSPRQDKRNLRLI